MEEAINFILTAQPPAEEKKLEVPVAETGTESVDVSFEDLGKDDINSTD
jgi:hypothetical protein